MNMNNHKANIKILFIQTNYPDFLKLFHQKNNTEGKSYNEIKKLWAKEYFGSSNFYLKNLKNYGWSGDEIIANDETIQNAWAKMHKINIQLPKSRIFSLIPARIKNLLNLNYNFKKIIYKQVEFYKPDVIYIHDVTYFSKEELKLLKKKTRLLVGQIAYPKPLNKSVFHEYDFIISSLPNYIRDFKKMGVKAEYLKWCFEDTILKNIKGKKRKYEVTYIGGLSPLHSKGNAILEDVSKKINVNLWGYGRPNIKQAWGKDMFKIFSESKIVINRHINISKNYANNMRMFEATGMGALLITDKKVNNHEFFEIGREIIVYKDSEDLIKKIKYYLKNDSERIKIAKRGQTRTLKEHTYRIRMRELDKILRKYLDNL